MNRSLALLIATLFAPAAAAEVPPAVQELIFNERLSEASDGFVYCLDVDDEDVSPSFLVRLQRSALTLVVASECMQNIRGSVHNASGRKAMFFRLRDFSPNGEASASVEFETYHNGLFASGETILLELVDGAWRIAGISRSWMA